MSIRHAFRFSLIFIFVNNHQIRNDDSNQNSNSNEIDTFRTTFIDYCFIAKIVDIFIEIFFFNIAKFIDFFIENFFFNIAKFIDVVIEKVFFNIFQYVANNEIQKQKFDVYATNTKIQTIYFENNDDVEKNFRCNIETHNFNIDDENAKKKFFTYFEFVDYYLKNISNDDN